MSALLNRFTARTQAREQAQADLVDIVACLPMSRHILTESKLQSGPHTQVCNMCHQAVGTEVHAANCAAAQRRYMQTALEFGLLSFDHGELSG